MHDLVRPNADCRKRVSSDPAGGHAHPRRGEPHDYLRTIIPTLFTGDPQVTHRISTRLCVGEIGILCQPHHPFAGLITLGERKNEEERVRDIQVRSEQDIKADLFSCHDGQANGHDANGRCRVGETAPGEHFKQEADSSNLAARPAPRPGRRTLQGFGENCTANPADRVRPKAASGKRLRKRALLRHAYVEAGRASRRSWPEFLDGRHRVGSAGPFRR